MTVSLRGHHLGGFSFSFARSCNGSHNELQRRFLLLLLHEVLPLNVNPSAVGRSFAHFEARVSSRTDLRRL